jgi:1-acyl-sn-glycerol-3-phosphate acyltransferase
MQRCIRAVWRVLCLAWHLARGMAILRWRFPRLALQQRQAQVQAWSVGLLSIFGLKLKVSGAFSTLPQSVLVVSNHVSWLDIAAIHAVLPQARFVAKADVHHWPLVGWLCTASRTLFIERERKRDAMRVVHEMAQALTEGDTIAVFPEGATNDGRELRPFHANLLQAAISTGCPILPVALRFSDPRDAISPVVEYAGDTTLWQSLRRILWAEGVWVTLAVCDPIDSAHQERRALALRCQETIERRLAAL